MALFERSIDELVAETVSDLLNNTTLSSAAPGTKTRAIIEASMKRINQAYRVFDHNLVMTFLRHAEGEFLDWIGEILNLERQGPSRATVSADQQVVKFFVETGLFGTLTEGPDIILPAGTIISSSPFLEGNSARGEYYLPVTVTLNHARSEQWVPVASFSTGPGANVGRYQLKYHNYNQIAKYKELKVINTLSIDNGTDVESDASYRYRLSKQVTAAEAANETAVRMAALSVPGVADIVTVPWRRGLGTFDIIVKATTPYVSDALLDSVTAAVEVKRAVGIDIEVAAPTTLLTQFQLHLFSRRALTRPEFDEINRLVKSAVTQYVNSLDIGEEFITNEAVQRVMEVSDEIKNMGSAAKPFESVIIRQPDGGGTIDITNQDYAPDEDARLVMDYEEPDKAVEISWD